MLMIAQVGPVIGHFQQKPLYAWVEDPFGLRYHFQRAAPELLNGGEVELCWGTDFLLPPAVLYRVEPVLAPAVAGDTC